MTSAAPTKRIRVEETLMTYAGFPCPHWWRMLTCGPAEDATQPKVTCRKCKAQYLRIQLSRPTPQTELSMLLAMIRFGGGV